MACHTYICPYSKRLKQYQFLMCKKLMKDSINYGIKDNAKNCICAYQYHCPKTGRMENSDSAKNCYEYHSN